MRNATPYIQKASTGGRRLRGAIYREIWTDNCRAQAGVAADFVTIEPPQTRNISEALLLGEFRPLLSQDELCFRGKLLVLFSCSPCSS